MLTSFINQRGTLTSYPVKGWQMNAKMPNPCRYGASIATRWRYRQHSATSVGVDCKMYAEL